MANDLVFEKKKEGGRDSLGLESPNAIKMVLLFGYGFRYSSFWS